jgi:hypothetical protein
MAFPGQTILLVTELINGFRNQPPKNFFNIKVADHAFPIKAV